MMLCSHPLFLRKNVTPVKTGVGIQAPNPPFVLSVAKRSRRTGCRIKSGMTRAGRQHGIVNRAGVKRSRSLSGHFEQCVVEFPDMEIISIKSQKAAVALHCCRGNPHIIYGYGSPGST